LPVDVAGADVQEGPVEATGLECLKQVQGAEQVDRQRACRIAEGFGNEGLAGQVNDRVGHVRPEGVEGAWLAEIVAGGDRQKLPFRGISLQAGLDVLSYESTETRNEQTLFQTAAPWSCISSIPHRLYGDV
jgi:hypothetical protein